MSLIDSVVNRYLTALSIRLGIRGIMAKKRPAISWPPRVRVSLWAQAPQTTRNRLGIHSRQFHGRGLLASADWLWRRRSWEIAGIAENEVTAVTPPRLSAKVSRLTSSFFIMIFLRSHSGYSHLSNRVMRSMREQ
jgi:hypothetical protein